MMRELKSSPLRAALRRVSGRFADVVNVEGLFTPQAGAVHPQRVYGLFATHDAKVRIGFDARRVPLPAAGGCMRVSAKVWLDEKTSRVTLMVYAYAWLPARADACATAHG